MEKLKKNTTAWQEFDYMIAKSRQFDNEALAIEREDFQEIEEDEEQDYRQSDHWQFNFDWQYR